jgi:hypothetical protein
MSLRLDEMRWELSAFGRLAHAKMGSQWHADTAFFVASKVPGPCNPGETLDLDHPKKWLVTWDTLGKWMNFDEREEINMKKHDLHDLR